ncbi:hypothetical protein AAG906_022773 [Vitis piasezkii]
MDTFGYEGIHPLLLLTSLTSFRSRTVRRKIRRFHGQTKSHPNEMTNSLEADLSRSILSGLVGKRSGGTQKEGKWRVCVDYTNLNNACPKMLFLATNRPNCGSTSEQGMLSFWMPSLDITDPHVPG